MQAEGKGQGASAHSRTLFPDLGDLDSPRGELHPLFVLAFFVDLGLHLLGKRKEKEEKRRLKHFPGKVWRGNARLAHLFIL